MWPRGSALEKNYAARKPIVNVESDYSGCGLVKPYGVEDVRLEWIDPATGAVRESRRLRWAGGDLHLTSPAYRVDVALRPRTRKVT